MDNNIKQLWAGNCLVCDKSIGFLWKHRFPDAENPDSAVSGVLRAEYGSLHDTRQLEIIICDDCVSDAIRNKRVRVLREAFAC